MHNWSTDSSTLSSKERERFDLEHLINFGLDGKKLSRTLLQKHIGTLSLDPNRKRYLKLLLDAPLSH